MNSKTVVNCRNISKDFGDGTQFKRVLHDITLDFFSGELSLLVGPSGCGKTTLISIIAGILSPTLGKVNVLGQTITDLSQKKLLNFRLHDIGFIFQQYHLIPTLTAAENACVPLAAAGVPRKQAVNKACEILEKLDMYDHVNQLPSQLSGGQQQRVAIARAMVHHPKIIVCDEPTAALDAQAGLQVMSLLREVALGPESACIVVTHDHRIFDFADRIVQMEDGRIVAIEQTKQVN